ncbi:MAG TPA: FtsX-like permease family protein [Candidatus Aquicultor sp.]|jgi:putative ABC transport system permease protein
MSFTVKLALKYLIARKARSFLTTLAIIFGVMIIFGLNGVLPAVEQAFLQNMSASANQADITVTSETQGAFDSSVAKKVLDVSGIAHVTSLLVRPVIVPTAQAPRTKDGQPVASFMLNGINPESITAVLPLRITQGRPLSSSTRKCMLISTNLSDSTGLKAGDTLTLPSGAGETKFSIVGLVEALPSPGAENLYVPIKDAQALFDQPGRINVIEAQVNPGADRKTVQKAVLKALDGGYKLGGAETGSQYLSSANLSKTLFTMFGVLALAMGGFIIFNTFRTIVTERRRDIAMLRAIGASRRTVLGLILTESLLQGVIGTALGIVAGYLMCVGILAAMRPLLESYTHIVVGGPVFSATTFVAAVTLGIGVTVLGGIVPARSASRVAPLEALRPPTAETERKQISRGVIAGIVLIGIAVVGLVSRNLGLASLGALLFLAGLVLVGPALVKPISSLFARLFAIAFAREGQIAEGNVARHPKRAAITASALMIGLAIIVALAGMIATLSAGFTTYIDKSLRSDYILMPQALVLGSGNVGAGPSLKKKIQSVPGIEAVTTIRVATAKAGSAELQVIGVDPVEYPKSSGLEFSAGDPASAYHELATGRTMIANGIFASRKGVKVGQNVTLQTPQGPETYKVVGIGMDYLNAKIATGYISQANLKRDFNEITDLLIMANRKAGANPAQVKASLQRTVKDYPAFTLFSIKEFRATQKRTIDGSLMSFYVLMLMFAVPSLIALLNTLGINVLERTREIGMLRAIGATRRQVRKLVVAESILLSIVGISFGILSGLWLGYILVSAMNVSGFQLPYFFPYAGILLTVAVGLLIGVVAALGPARHAARLNIVSALQYE